MKSAFGLVLMAALASTAAAASLIKKQAAVEPYVGRADALDYAAINATGGGFVIGENSNPTCPGSVECPYAPYVPTAFICGEGLLSLYVKLEGGQLVYVDPTSGRLLFQEPGAPVPVLGTVGFTLVDGTVQYLAQDWLACPQPFKIHDVSPYLVYSAAIKKVPTTANGQACTPFKFTQSFLVNDNYEADQYS